MKIKIDETIGNITYDKWYNVVKVVKKSFGDFYFVEDDAGNKINVIDAFVEDIIK